MKKYAIIIAAQNRISGTFRAAAVLPINSGTFVSGILRTHKGTSTIFLHVIIFELLKIGSKDLVYYKLR